MHLYRIVKKTDRTKDLSGTGAFTYGGRWNNKGTYMLYTSENSSLALLEAIVHFEEDEYPPHLFIIQLEIDKTAPIYTLPDVEYPKEWLKSELIENKQLGDLYMHEQKYFGIKVKSAINTLEFNYLLNPLFPGFHDIVTINAITEIPVDYRLIKR